jgi:hypothetical protein
MRRAAALRVLAVLGLALHAGRAQAEAPSPFAEIATGFVPVANDVPILIGIGLRFARMHELWARAGTMPTGDDVGLRFGVGGYRIALRPDAVVRPIFGAFVAGLPDACGHDANGRRTCEGFPLLVFAGTAGVRLEPVPWFGVFAELALGLDSYPNPFGIVQLGLSFFVH